MKPDLLASADEVYGPPNPRMRCAEALVSKKDLGWSRPVSFLHIPSFPFGSLLQLWGKKNNRKKG